MFGTSQKEESAYSDEASHEHNRILNEHWTHEFFKFVTDGKYTAQTKLKDFMQLFPYSTVSSHINFQDTLVGREFKDVYLSEWWPLPSNKIKGE